jgi:hypothetical protein
MTEKEWLSAKEASALALHLRASKHPRKARLYGVACCRQAMQLAPEPRLLPLLDAAERFAEGELTWDDLKPLRRVLATIRKGLGEPFGPDEAAICVVKAVDRATNKPAAVAVSADEEARNAAAALARPKWVTGSKRAEKQHIAFAHDIFGNPFRPVAFDSAWRTDTVLSLARVMYETRDFAAMPILADALQDVGCEHAAVLDHCRDPQAAHVRGCWVVDLVLGKS